MLSSGTLWNLIQKNKFMTMWILANGTFMNSFVIYPFFIYKEEITVSEDGKEKTEEGTSTKIAKGITVGE